MAAASSVILTLSMCLFALLRNRLSWAPKIALASSLGVLVFSGIVLQAEGSSKKILSRVFSATALVALAVYAISFPDNIRAVDAIRYLLLALSGFLFLECSPFLRQGGNSSELWHFSRILGYRLSATVLYSAVLFGGVAGAMGLADRLFGIAFPFQVYHIYFWLVAGFFAVWHFLGGIPSPVSDLSRLYGYPREFSIFSEYILIPLVGLYFIILYSYSAKIIITRILPVTWISYMIIIYSIAGMSAWLFVYPVRNESTSRWIRIYSKWFNITLVPLLVLLGVAMGSRISSFGLTEKRHLVVVLAIWLFVMAIYLAVTRQMDLRVPGVTLSLVLLVCSAGPLSSGSMSLKSQLGRLEKLLTEHHVLSAADTDIPYEVPWRDAKQISSIVQYLKRTHGLEPLARRFPGLLEGIDLGTGSPEQIVKGWGVKWIPPWQKQPGLTYIRYEAKGDPLLRIDGFDYIYRFEQYHNPHGDRGGSIYIIPEVLELIWDPSFTHLTFRGEGLGPASLDLAALLTRLEGTTGPNVEQDRLTLKTRGKDLEVIVYLKRINGQLAESGPVLNNITATFLLDIR